MVDIKAIKQALRALRAEMRALGIKKTSPFNGGMDRETQRYNERRFTLETQLKSAETIKALEIKHA